MNMVAQDVGTAPPDSIVPAVSGRHGRSGRLARWSRLALVGVCLVAAVLYAWAISSRGWGNPYYAAAVKSMSQNFTNFVFGSFDPVGVVTVDKPPMAFWPIVLSTMIFGYHGWSVLLPQVVEGVAAVFLLHRTVRRWAGEDVALLSALVLALTPVTVAIDRNSDPDTLMVLLLVAAAYALTRSIEPRITPSGATRWLMLAACFLGFGFLTKMLQPWIVLPAFVLAYVVGSRASVGRRVRDLLAAGATLLVSAGWWVALVTFWPGEKPYFGGSTDGSVLQLVFGYNGFGRIFGQTPGGGAVPKGSGPGGFPDGNMVVNELPGAGQGPVGPPKAVMGGFDHGVGITRMFKDEVGGQISWLLPFCLLILVVVGVGAGRRRLAGHPVGDPVRRAGWVLWGGWLLLTAAVFSFMGGIFHEYYTTQLAPAVAALTAAGLVALWRRYRQPGGYVWLLLPAAVVLTAGWAWVLVSRDMSWHGWLRYAVAGVAALSLAALVVGRRWSSRVALRWTTVTLSLITLLLAPGVWSVATAVRSGGSAMAHAGPVGRPPQGGTAGTGETTGSGPLPPGPGKAGTQFTIMGGGPGAGLSDEQRKILAYAQANSGGARVTLAVEGGTGPASSYIINSDAAVIGMGGFSGQDPAPTRDQLASWVRQGKLRYVLVPGVDKAGGNTGGAKGSPNGGPGGGARNDRTEWVQQHCAVVDPSAYGGSSRPTQHGGNQTGEQLANQILYDCAAH